MASTSPRKKRKNPPVSLIERDEPILDSAGGFVPFRIDREEYDLPDDMRVAANRGDEDGSLIVDLTKNSPISGAASDGSVIKELSDGSMEVTFGDDGAENTNMLDAAANSTKEFDDNLAEGMSESDLNAIAIDILEMIDADIQANAPWDKRLQAGLKILGIAPPTANELPFKGAASITHPIIAEAVVQFNARSYPELMPPTGPVKAQVIGQVEGQSNEDIEKSADRVEKHMNFQIMNEDECYPEEMDQLLFYLPLAGSAFKKTYYDKVLGYTTSRFIRGEDVIMPYNATSLESASRYAIRMKMLKNDIKKAQLTGFYRNVELTDPTTGANQMDSQSTLKSAYDDADGKTDVSTDKDGVHYVYEAYIDYEVKGFEHKNEDGSNSGLLLPYIITIERESNKVLAIRRNYRESEPLRGRRYLTHYKYLPGLGCKGFGLIHAMGGIAETLTGSIRALLDSASFATLQGGFKSKDARLPAGSVEMRPGVWTDIDLTSEELKNAFFTPPFKEPSMALFKLMEGMEQNGRRYLGTTETAMGDAPANGPVGTTVALIEQSTKVMSGIHRRLHRAQGKEFKIRAEINAEFLPEGEIYFDTAGGREVITRDDYANRQVQIVPVSDPNIVSSTQRITIAQAVKQASIDTPGLYDPIKVEEKMLRAMGVSEPDELLIKEDEIPLCDPATEGSRLLAQKKIKAFQAQNHLAHEAVHMAQIEYYKTLPDPVIAQGLIMQMTDHIAKHKAYAMYNQTQQLTGTRLPELDLYSDDTKKNSIPPEIEYQVSEQMAQMVGALIQEARSKAPPPAEDMEAKAKIERDAAAARQSEQQKQEAFIADEARKQQAFEAEMIREEQRKAMESEQIASQQPDHAKNMNQQLKDMQAYKTKMRELALKEREHKVNTLLELHKEQEKNNSEVDALKKENESLKQQMAIDAAINQAQQILAKASIPPKVETPATPVASAKPDIDPKEAEAKKKADRHAAETQMATISALQEVVETLKQMKKQQQVQPSQPKSMSFSMRRDEAGNLIGESKIKE